MIISNGTFEDNRSVTSLIYYEIDKSLITKNRYRITFKYVSSLLDYWRREASDRLELYGRIAIIEINDETSPIKIDSTFDKFLIKNIQEYYKDCEIERKFTTNFLSSGTTIEELIERYPGVKEQLKTKGINDLQEQTNFLRNKITRAY